MKATPTFDRRAWLALWAQGRRRRRQTLTPVPTGLLTGLVAHFGFEETSGPRLDDVSGQALDWINQEPGSAAGIIGNAVAFNGSGSYLAGAEETMACSPTANGFAVSVWINFTNTANPFEPAYVASVWDDNYWPAGSAWHIFANPGSGMVAAEMVGSVSGFRGLYGWGGLAAWAHVCLVFDPLAGQWSLYLDSVVVATVACDYAEVIGRLGVGLHTNPITPAPDCMIDELTIWSRTLSATDVAQLYNHGDGLAYEMF